MWWAVLGSNQCGTCVLLPPDLSDEQVADAAKKTLSQMFMDAQAPEVIRIVRAAL